MAVYVTNDTDLTSVADAIRDKAGTTGGLVFPNGFVSAVNNLPAGVPGGGPKIKYIIPASYIPVRDSSGLGFSTTQFTFTRENVNQFFAVDWLLQDTIDYTKAGYWIQHIVWLHYKQGNYESQNNIHVGCFGAGKAGNTSMYKVTNYPKTSLSNGISAGALVGTSSTYTLHGENYKGLIIITDSSYNGNPIVDASKLTQFFPSCNGQLTAGW